MKKQILTLLLITCSIIVNAQVKNLDRLPKATRDSILLDLAKKTILEYGPEYYEINRPPIIERKIAPVGDEDAGRVWFTIKYFYKQEFYDKYPAFVGDAYLVEVYVWEDTGLVSDVMFEDRGFSHLDESPKTKSTNGERSIFIRKSWMPVLVKDTTKNK